MSGLLDSQQIEELFERASEGTLPLESHVSTERRARWLRTVDFTRPTKFTSDQERRIRRAMDAFAQLAMTRMAAEHRIGLELEVIDAGQFTWTNAFAHIPENSVYVSIDTEPHEARMLISAELPMIIVALERLLGGKPETVDRERALTDIDLMLVGRFIGTMVDTLSGVWFDIAEVRLAVSGVETASELVQVAAGSEPTFMLTLEVRLDGESSTITLLIPYGAIEPVASAFSRHDEEEVRHDPLSTAAVQHGLSLVDVTLRAEVGDTTLTIEEVLALRPGDVLRLDTDADGDVTLYADRTPVHYARAGRSGTRRAVQVTLPVEVKP